MDDFNTQAHRLLQAGQKQQARELLEATLRAMPPGWKPIQDGQGPSLRAAFWNQEEFFAYFHGSPKPTRSTSWVPGSYFRAWLQLAEMACDDHNFALALEYISYGVDLESDHPDLWNFRGYVLGKMKHFEESLAAYEHAATCRSWAPASQVARALRGQGLRLVDLNRLDEAETALRRSLYLAPGNPIAMGELDYIAKARDQMKRNMPWFARAVLYPPADERTRAQIALAEDMPSRAGPEVVGRHYFAIVTAFMDRGWEGFEEEFDRYLPRDDPRYWQVKQDLLCEPVFNAKVHREMTSIITGEVPVEEMMVRLKARFSVNSK